MYISSDTNIWFDFEAIGFPEHPFLLDNEYYLSDVTYHDEIQFSETIRKIVESEQLHITTVPVRELQQASEFAEKYPAISIHDAIALSIAKSRGWTLLSGDGKLRDAAEQESVECHGTLKVQGDVPMYKNNKMNYKEHTEHETQVLGLTKEDVGAIMDKMTR